MKSVCLTFKSREKTWREWIHTEFIKYLSLRLYYTRDDAEEHMKHIFDVDKEFKDWPWYFKALSLWVERNVLYRIMQRQMRKYVILFFFLFFALNHCFAYKE